LNLQGGLWQVVLRHLKDPFKVLGVSADIGTSSQDFCLRDVHETIPSEPPVSLTLLRHMGGALRLVIRISHAQYDGVSSANIFQSFIGGPIPDSAVPDFSAFLSHSHVRRAASMDYWTNLLKGSQPTLLRHCLALRRPDIADVSLRTLTAQAQIRLPRCLGGKTSTATLASAAWAQILALLTGETDVVYEHLVAGRNSAIPQIEDVVGCCLNLVPVRVSLADAQTPAELLRAVQEQFLAMGEADSLGTKDIIEHCTDWPADSSLESTIQHESTAEDHYIQGAGHTLRIDTFRNPHAVPTGIYMYSVVRGDQLRFQLMTNTHIMSAKAADAIVNGLVRLVDNLDACYDTPLATWTQGVDIGGENQ
jgi:hypothetical protein